MMSEAELRPAKVITEILEPFAVLIEILEAVVDKIDLQEVIKTKDSLKKEEDDNFVGESDSRLSLDEASGSTSPVYPAKEINSEVEVAEPSTSFATFADTVSCPACSTFVSKKHINHHLDNECNPTQKDEDTAPKRKTMKTIPMPVFHILKDSEIKKKLKEQGIDNTKGDRKSLEQRLKKFIVLWNSQCDEENPLSRMEIIMKLKKAESTKAKTVTESVSHLKQYNAKSDPSVIDRMQKKLRTDHKDQFASLIQQAKQRRNVNKATNDNAQTVNLTQQDQVPLTPKRKIAEDEDEQLQEGAFRTNVSLQPDDTLGGALAEEESVTTPKPKRPFFGTPKPPIPKISCPICFVEFPEIFIQSHAERCLDKPQPRGNSNVGGTESGDHNSSYDLLSVTPEIIEGSSPDFICSTPQRAGQEDEARSSSSPQLNATPMRPKRGGKKSNSNQGAANTE